MRQLLLAALCCVVGLGQAMAQQHVDLAVRPGLLQPVTVTDARNPVAAAILFPGGNGVVRELHGNFLLRVADAFVAQGITVAVADTPSDHPRGMDPAFRAGAAEAEDIAAIVGFLRARSHVPVWLIGTSNGSVSAANGAARIGPPQLAGVVLTSSVWAGGMMGVTLGDVRLPVLVVHNRSDGCRWSPPGMAEPAMAALTQAPARQLVMLSGGQVRGGPCGGASPHGYLGIEDQAVRPIVAWIRAH